MRCGLRKSGGDLSGGRSTSTLVWPPAHAIARHLDPGKRRRGNQHTLGDILESLIGSHDCGVVFAKISRSKPGLDLEIQWMVG